MKNSLTGLFLGLSVAALSGLTGLQAYAEKDGDVLEENMGSSGHLDHPDWFMQSFLDIGEDIAEATEQGKYLALYFYQDGCPYCRKLIEENFGDEEIVAYTRRHFEIVAFNIYGSKEVTVGDDILAEKAFSKELGVHFTPTLIFYDMHGEEIFRMNGYYQKKKFFAMLKYLAEGHAKKEEFLDYYPGDEPAKGSSGKTKRVTGTLLPPFSFSKATFNRDSRPLLVVFDRQNCMSCQELHQDIFVRPETESLLKSFQLAVVDIDSEQVLQTPHGDEMTPGAWARSLDVKSAPSLVFFDNDLREVSRVEGYVKAFHVQTMLEYVATKAYRDDGVQKFLQKRSDRLRAAGQRVDIMN